MAITLSLRLVLAKINKYKRRILLYDLERLRLMERLRLGAAVPPSKAHWLLSSRADMSAGTEVSNMYCYWFLCSLHGAEVTLVSQSGRQIAPLLILAQASPISTDQLLSFELGR